MRKQGFTLIELLAVIIILAIIALIATPLILNVIDKAKQRAFKNSAYGIIKAAEFASLEYSLDNKLLGQIVFEYNDGIESSNVSGLKLNYNGTKPKSGTIAVNLDGKVALAITDGVYCAEKDFEETEVVVSIMTSEEDCNLEIDLVDDNTIIDERDNQTYKIVQIGDQVWFVENLRYTGNGCLDNPWSSVANACREYTTPLGTEVYYQWRAAMNGSTEEGAQGLCPDGWHIPTDEEFKILEGNVDSIYGIGNSIWNNTGHRGIDVGKKLKSINYWINDGNGTNTVGFNLLPTGWYSSGGLLDYVGSASYLWLSSLSSFSNAWSRGMSSSNDGVSRYGNNIAHGFSVRCVQD